MKVPLLDLKEQNQKLRPQIEAALGRVLDTNAFILGDEVKALEAELADYCGSKYAIGCASGSDAILLGLMALDVKACDEVITTLRSSEHARLLVYDEHPDAVAGGNGLLGPPCR